MFFERSIHQPRVTGSAGLKTPDWLIWLVAIICVWTGLGTYGVLNNNEGLYARIPLDMLNSTDLTHWIIPHLNGLPYMEKPPLLYWLTALGFWIFGNRDWVVRLVPTLAALGCVWLILNFCRRIYRPQVGRVAALIFISGLGVQVIGRTLLFDMLLTAFLTAALMHAYLYKIEHRIRDLRIAHICLALAVLTKGLVALLLFGMVTASWIFMAHRNGAWKQLAAWIDRTSILLFLAITVPWFIAASLVEPIFPWFFFINEHLLRFLGSRLPHDYYSGPWWYYLPRIVLYLFPWSLLLPIVMFSKSPGVSRVERQEYVALKKNLMLGWLVPLLFFSISSAKANYYLIVGMPFLTLNLAFMLEQRNYLAGWRNTILGLMIALIAVILAGAAHWYPQQLFGALNDAQLTVAGMPWQQFSVRLLLVVAALALLSAALAWLLPRLGLIAYAVLPLCFMVAMLSIVKAMESSVSDRAMVSFIESMEPARTVYLYRNFEQNSSLAFYLKEPLKIIDSNSNDLYWGDRLRPDNEVMIERRQFRQQDEPKVVVVPNGYMDEFAHYKLQSRFRRNRQFDHATVFY